MVAKLGKILELLVSSLLTDFASRYEEDGDGKSAMSQLNNQDLNAELNK